MSVERVEFPIWRHLADIYRFRIFYTTWRRKLTLPPSSHLTKLSFLYQLPISVPWYRRQRGCVPYQRPERHVPYHGTIGTVPLFENAG